jgi:hypothetical protein
MLEPPAALLSGDITRRIDDIAAASFAAQQSKRI